MLPLPFAGDGLVHALWVGLGIAAATLVYVAERRRRSLTDDRLWTIFGFALAFAAVGSRLGTWFQEVDPSRNRAVIEWWLDGNRSVLAALVGAWLGVLLGKRLMGYRASTGDLFAPATAVALAIGRVGCLLTELPGTPTGGDWGIVLTPKQAALFGVQAGVGLHPSFVYEIAFHVLAFVLMWRYRDSLPRPGDLFVCFVAGYAAFRFGVEFIRGNELVWFGLSRPQWFLTATSPLLAWRVARIWHPAKPGARLPAPDIVAGGA